MRALKVTPAREADTGNGAGLMPEADAAVPMAEPGPALKPVTRSAPPKHRRASPSAPKKPAPTLSECKMLVRSALGYYQNAGGTLRAVEVKGVLVIIFDGLTLSDLESE